ncbi:hypothetical protein ACCQ14_01785 [Xanthomonas sp. NCPPB 2865]|jgi:hypothetical protein|uniref:hypothetical protein n=1 Tax=Xanthomonas TaxID=338 RepID=UPI0006CAF09A|nr:MULTISPECIES: hypothetical protein [Xanthomonas]
MDLKEFVRETLVQIAAGVRDAQTDVRTLGGIVNPATQNPSTSGNSYFASVDDLHHVFLVDFDVAVTVAENAGTSAQAKLNVATILSLGAGGQSSNSSAATNRLTFKVPLALPIDEPSHAKLSGEIAESRAKMRQALGY